MSFLHSFEDVGVFYMIFDGIGDRVVLDGSCLGYFLIQGVFQNLFLGHVGQF